METEDSAPTVLTWENDGDDTLGEEDFLNGEDTNENGDSGDEA